MKKKFRKVMALLLAAVMVLAMAVTVSAEDTSTPYTLTLNRTTTETDTNETTTNAYNVYKVASFDFTVENGGLIYTNLKAESDFASVLTSDVLKNLAGSNVKNADRGTDAADPAEGTADTRTDMQSLADSLATLTEQKNDDGTEKISATKTITKDDEGTVSGLDAGYYLVKETTHNDEDSRIATKYILVAVPDTVTSTTSGETTTYSVNTTATVNLKTSEAGLTKKIVLEDSATGENVTTGENATKEGTLVDTNVVAIGDTITYQIDTTIPQYPSYVVADEDDINTTENESAGDAGNLQYYITDTMSKGLTLQKKENSTTEDPSYKIKVEISDGEQNTEGNLTYSELTSGTDYKVTAETVKDENGANTGETLIKIYLSDAKVVDNGGGAVKVTIEATLNEDAETNETGNPNSADLTYTNNWDAGGKYTTPKDTVITYTGELTIEKVDGKSKDEDGNYTTKLAGAEFAVYGPKNLEKSTPNGVAETIYIGSDGKQYGDLTAETKTNEDGTETTITKTAYYYYIAVTTGDGEDTDGDGTADSVLGEAKISGLDNGTYYAVETKAPTGYNLDSTPQKLALKVEENVKNSENTKTAALETATGLVTTEGNDTTQRTYKAEWNLNNAESATTTAQIENTKGATLPGTGGIGSTIFTVGGIILVLLAAALFFVYVRRMRRNA